MVGEIGFEPTQAETDGFTDRSYALYRLTAGCGKGLESEHMANPGLVLVEGDIVFPPNNDLTIKKPGKC